MLMQAAHNFWQQRSMLISAALLPPSCSECTAAPSIVPLTETLLAAIGSRQGKAWTDVKEAVRRANTSAAATAVLNRPKKFATSVIRAAYLSLVPSASGSELS